MLGRVSFFLVLFFLLPGMAVGESPVRGKYIQPPEALKPKASPSPAPSTAVIEPCGPNVTDDTCRIPSSDPISKIPDASTSASSVKKPDAKVDPIKAAPAAPPKKPAQKK